MPFHLQLKSVAGILVTVALFSSCRSLISYEVTHPAEVKLEDRQYNMLVINRHDTTILDINQEKKLAVYKDGFNAFYQNIISNINYDNRFLVIGEEFIPKTGLIENDLSEYHQQRLAQNYLYDLVLVINDFSIDRLKDIEVYESDFGVSRTAHFSVAVEAMVFLYDKNGRLLDAARVELQHPIDSRAVISGLFAVGPSLGNQGHVIIPLARDVANSYINRFYPSQVTVSNFIFTGKHFKGLEAMIRNRQFLTATEFLLPLTEHENSRVANKAIYNMAIVKEAEGQYQQAEELMELYQKRAGKR